MKAHATKWLKCRVRDRGRLRFGWSVPVQGRLALGLGPRRLQVLNPQQGSGLPEGVS